MKFNYLKIKGEWFQSTQELMNFINRIEDSYFLNNNIVDINTINIDVDYVIILKAFIDKYPHLRFKSESQVIIHFLQEKALNIIKENPNLIKIVIFL